MWHIQWVRRLIRRNTRKIPEYRAIQWKNRLSILYALCATQAFGLVVYMCSTGRHDWMREGGYVPDEDIPPARSFAQILGVKNADVIRISGMQVVDNYQITEDDGFDDKKEIAEDKEVVAELE